ncbi:hypothetical protein KCP78_06285 [Salmonella enterica subsp. enterica]|nr:hypothetical protein KCP78_06285 [Salmonella enterica subsp. enterica]
MPTYAQIGILRQYYWWRITAANYTGLTPVEISGAGTVYWPVCAEGKRGIISSLVAMGTNCGTLSAVTAIWAVMFFALEREQLIARGWRIPLTASVVVMIFAIWLRMNLKRKSGIRKVSEAKNRQR